MRPHWVLPTMRAVTEERPWTEAMWWWVWRGIIGLYFPLGDDSDEGICLRLRGVYGRLEFAFQRPNG